MAPQGHHFNNEGLRFWLTGADQKQKNYKGNLRRRRVSRIALRDSYLHDPAELLAQFERPGDPAQRLQGSARADDRDVAVVKDAAHQALVNVQTLHLVEVHLDRVARYESALHDNSPVGQDQFSGLSPDDRGQYHGEADHQRYRNHSKRRAGVVSGGDISAQRSQQKEAADEIRKEKLPMGNGGAIDDSFTLGQYGINVGTHGLPHWCSAAIMRIDVEVYTYFLLDQAHRLQFFRPSMAAK